MRSSKKKLPIDKVRPLVADMAFSNDICILTQVDWKRGATDYDSLLNGKNALRQIVNAHLLTSAARFGSYCNKLYIGFYSATCKEVKSFRSKRSHPYERVLN